MDSEKMLMVLVAAIVGAVIKTLTDRSVLEKLFSKIDAIVDAITSLEKSMLIREGEIKHLQEELLRNEREHVDLFRRVNQLEQR